MTDASHCRSCGAPIEWAITVNGRRIPLDLEATPSGNLIVVDGTARPPRDDEDRPFLMRVSHFATCPTAGVHRRKRAR